MIKEIYFSTRFILFVAAFFIISSSFSSNCKWLKNRKYKVHFNQSQYTNYIISINGNKYLREYQNGNIDSGTIKWISHCAFKFIPANKSAIDTSTAFLKKMYNSFGEEFIELYHKKNNRVKFRTIYTNNVHFPLNTGEFVKMKE